MKLLVFCRHNREIIENLAKNYSNVKMLELKSDLHNRPQGFQKVLEGILENAGTKYDEVILLLGECALRFINVEKYPFKITFLHSPNCLRSFIHEEDLHKAPMADTFLLCASWMNSDGNLTDELRKLTNRYGEKKAMLIFFSMYKNYKRVCYLYVKENEPEERKAKEFADLLHLEFIMLPMDLSILDKFIRK